MTRSEWVPEVGDFVRLVGVTEPFGRVQIPPSTGVDSSVWVQTGDGYGTTYQLSVSLLEPCPPTPDAARADALMRLCDGCTLADVEVALMQFMERSGR
jgi:hypothetical protein